MGQSLLAQDRPGQGPRSARSGGLADGWGGWGRAAQGIFLLWEAGGGREGSQAGRGAEARQHRDVSPGDGQSGLWSAEGEGPEQDHRSQMG